MEKWEVDRAPNLGCRGLSHLNDLMFCQKTSVRDVIHEQLIVIKKLPIMLPTAATFWIIHIVSAEECSSLMQNFMQICCSVLSVILNVMSTQYTQQYPLTPVTSRVKSSLFTHVHSSSLSLAARLHQCHTNHSRYINNGWTFLDRPCMYSDVCVFVHTSIHIYTDICMYICLLYMHMCIWMHSTDWHVIG